MLERLKELLTQRDIASKELLPIKEGDGGAYLFSVDNKYVVKYSCLPKLDFMTRTNHQREFDFYKVCSGKSVDFIPEIIFQDATDDEMIIVMKKYTPIKAGEWDENLLKQAMELCARINAIDPADFKWAYQEKEERSKIVRYARDGTPIYEPYPLSLSYRNWIALQEKFPEHIDAGLLKEMYDSFDETDSYAGKPDIPETLCHGDWHPNNCLRDGDQLIVCDWEGLCMGRGVDSVTWFCCVGAKMGININRDKLIEKYCGALFKYANIEVDANDFYKYIAANEFTQFFRFGTANVFIQDNYFQSADIDGVLNSYNTMVMSYTFLQHF